MDNKKGKTIKQLADEIGVSKQAIFYRINKEPMSNDLSSLMTKENGSLIVSFDGQNIIKKAFSVDSHQTFDDSLSSKKNVFDDSLIRILQNELFEKNKQLDVKDHQIECLQENISELTSAVENLTKSLKSSQALHAGTMQQTFLTDKQPESSEKDNPLAQSTKPVDGIDKKSKEKKGFWKKLFR